MKSIDRTILEIEAEEVESDKFWLWRHGDEPIGRLGGQHGDGGEAPVETGEGARSK